MPALDLAYSIVDMAHLVRNSLGSGFFLFLQMLFKKKLFGCLSLDLVSLHVLVRDDESVELMVFFTDPTDLRIFCCLPFP